MLRWIALVLLGITLSAASCGDEKKNDPGPTPDCGDGTLNAGEDCDNAEGNSDTRPDACRTTCVKASCGDGVVDEGEACDDGNDSDDDACLAGCVAARCGDGTVQAGVEDCDDGDANSDTGVDACRTTCETASCGDGVKDGGEACDDGNKDDGDACVSCQSARCGDGHVQEGEACDDGAANSDVLADACRTSCQEASCGDRVVDTGEACDDPSPGCVACQRPGCGDGHVDEGEACDDGAANSDVLPDACRTSCELAGCGDAVTDAGEACDDGNDDAGDACVSCHVARCGDGQLQVGVEECDEGPNNANTPGRCRTTCLSPVCHDGIQDPGEGCDDRNLDDHDGCVGSCQVATCGDGFLRGGVEACDDGAANSDVQPDACRSDCSPSRCGDGATDTGEACDDGNEDETDFCVSCADARCGDGAVQAGLEACDDGNDDDGDACVSCAEARCGDGFVEADVEACDDDNDDDSDACVACAAARCGDGFVQFDVESCDEGDANSDELADACRTNCSAPGCGDGVIDGGEMCDDAGFECDPDDEFCFDECIECRFVGCGDGFLDERFELCDDGDSNSDERADACRTSCVPAFCGDGVTDSIEECDDGNGDDGDGCSFECLNEEEKDHFPLAGEVRVIEDTLDVAGDTMIRLVADNGPNTCRGSGLTHGAYDVHELVNDSGEDQDVLIEAHWAVGGLVLGAYVDEFEPEESLLGCQSASDQYDWDLDDGGEDGARTSVVNVPAESTLYVVVHAYGDWVEDVDYTLLVANAAVTLEEVEPNDDTDEATFVGSNQETVAGVFEGGGDEDYFSFDLDGGARYRVELLSANGNCFEDSLLAWVAIYDDDGGLVGENNSHPFYDDQYEQGCAGLVFTAPRSGLYFAETFPIDAADDRNAEYFFFLRQLDPGSNEGFPEVGEAVRVSGTLDDQEDGLTPRLYPEDGPNTCGNWDAPHVLYDVHTFVNDTGDDQDVQVEAHFDGAQLILAAYVDGFDPDNPDISCESASTRFDWQLAESRGARTGVVHVPDGSRLYVVVEAMDDLDGQVVGYDLFVENAANTLEEGEPNDDAKSANVVSPVFATVSAGFNIDDVDVYAFDALEGVDYRFEVLSENGTCWDVQMTSKLEILAEDGDEVLDTSDAHPFFDGAYGTGCSGLIFSARHDGTFYARVSTDVDSDIPYWLLIRER